MKEESKKRGHEKAKRESKYQSKEFKVQLKLFIKEL